MNLLHVLVLFLNAAHLILSVNEPKVGKFRPTFDEIVNSGQNALNEQADHDDNIDQDVEAYNSHSTDQNLTQEDPDGIDQGGDEIIEGINEENVFSEKEKREIICKFHALKEEYKKKGKVTKKERTKIEEKFGKNLGVYRQKIYKWKKEFGLSRKTKKNKNSFYEKKKREFIARMDEIKMSQRGEQNKLAKDLGISHDTFHRWKKEFGLPIDSL
ncbi:hypothetical protein GPALN_012077 [Globodera pallida]|nr:hypothetical protein GPALN_012077 [Globodera pallida]